MRRRYHMMTLFMPYKDELTLLLGQNIKDKTNKLEEELKLKNDENEVLKVRIEELKRK